MSLSSELITHYFPHLSAEQKNQFSQLAPLYEEWNAKINVVSRKDIESLYEKHVLHSLGIAKVINFKPGTKVLDVGTGGGFPGIPLAIFFPETTFHLVDSIGKKIKVVQAVAEALGLKNLTAEHNRAENVKGKYDFVVSRAVTRMAPFYGWIQNKFSPTSTNDMWNGVLYLKGGDLDEELAELGLEYKSFPLSEYFSEEFFETKKVIYIPS
jgi:16S rRNA (guanine527-N7)-methyltransferase